MADENSIHCPSCGKSTALTERSRCEKRNKGGAVVATYSIAECNNCDFFVLVKRVSGAIVKIHPDPLPDPVHEKTPGFLKRDIEEAKKCFAVGCYRATSVMARRALQSCCFDKKAPDKNLKEQIDWLLSKQIITKDLRDWADEVRFTGNDAAHPPKKPEEDEEVSCEDAHGILTLLEQFVNVLYVTPALATEMKEKRDGQDKQPASS